MGARQLPTNCGICDGVADWGDFGDDDEWFNMPTCTCVEWDWSDDKGQWVRKKKKRLRRRPPEKTLSRRSADQLRAVVEHITASTETRRIMLEPSVLLPGKPDTVKTHHSTGTSNSTIYATDGGGTSLSDPTSEEGFWLELCHAECDRSASLEARLIALRLIAAELALALYSGRDKDQAIDAWEKFRLEDTTND